VNCINPNSKIKNMAVLESFRHPDCRPNLEERLGR
jgi:hypothetical protein